MNRHEQYKRRSAGFGNANAGRLARAGRHEEQRRVNRAKNVAGHRALDGDAERETLSTRRADPDARLRKWKEEQRRRKKLEERQKKPIFKVGIVHHKIYSPPFSDRFTKKKHPDNPKGAKRVLTRSFAPPNYAFTIPSGVIEIPMFDGIAGASPNGTGSTQIIKARLEWRTAVVRLSGATSAPATNRNSSSDFRLRSSSKDESIEEANVEDKSSSEFADFVDRQPRTTSRSGTPVFTFSPYLLMSRAKDSARKEPTIRTSIRRSSANEIPRTAKESQSKDFSGNDSCPPKSTRDVDFNDDVLLEKVPAAETAQKFINNNTDRGRTLVRTCSFDLNDNFVEPHDTMKNITVRRNIKKRLDFEHESFDECENTNTAESATTLAAVPKSTVIPDIVVTLSTPMKKAS